MLHPSYTDLMKVVNQDVEEGAPKIVNSRYSIVLATAKRARQIIDKDEPLVPTKPGAKPLSIAIDEVNDAKIKIDFGRMVKVDRIILWTRADFPHDNWWEQVSFTFSDGSHLDMKMEKSEKPHEITFEEKTITWVEVHDMKKADDPSPFPALTQLQVYGRG